MSEELKPCPFCGSDNVEYYNGWKYGDRAKDGGKFREPSLCCRGCGIGMRSGSFGFGVTDEAAKNNTLEDWNKRPTKITREEAFQFCVKRMKDLEAPPPNPLKYHAHKFGKTDIGDLLDLIYGERKP